MKQMIIPVGISARHLHVTKEHLTILFGEGAELHPIKELMGGQFAAKERVHVVGNQGRILENVRILGPLRSATQVEISKTDAMFLKVNAPLKDSGDIAGTAAVKLIGPKGEVTLEEGCIVAKRHVHMSNEDAKAYGLVDNQRIAVTFEGERKGTLENILVRVHPSFTLEMHIDTDEANAMDIGANASVRWGI
ncbi:MAG: phosphate propanoyltransferase [Cellulosilyticaceae bacterium]